MSIYQKRNHSHNYRKIYEQYYGPIPKEDNGRTYEVHHIDGDHNNNCHTNLVAVTTQDHFNIHFSQGDFRSCALIAHRLSLDEVTVNILRKKIGDINRDKTIYQFINVDESKFIGTREEFQKKYPTVHCGNLSKIINKKLPSTQGWRLDGEPKPIRNSFHSDNIIYEFTHKDGRKFTGSRTELIDSHCDEFLRKNRRSDSSNLWRLTNHKGGVKSVRGWTLVPTGTIT
jgi:hypothetical protein